MKLVCDDAIRKQLEEQLTMYAHLEITLVQKGYSYDMVCIQFDPLKPEELIEILEQLNQENYQAVLANKEDRMYFIDPFTIVYIEGYRKEAFLHTQTTTYKLTYRLYEIEELLEPYGFLRISKSIIVNIRMIDHIMPAFNACYTMELKNGIALECSRQYWKRCKQKLKMR